MHLSQQQIAGRTITRVSWSSNLRLRIRGLGLAATSSHELHNDAIRVSRHCCERCTSSRLHCNCTQKHSPRRSVPQPRLDSICEAQFLEEPTMIPKPTAANTKDKADHVVRLIVAYQAWGKMLVQEPWASVFCSCRRCCEGPENPLTALDRTRCHRCRHKTPPLLDSLRSLYFRPHPCCRSIWLVRVVSNTSLPCLAVPSVLA